MAPPKIQLLKLFGYNHHFLLGILLGYGRHNAFLFQQRSELPMEKVEDFDRDYCFGPVWQEEELAEWAEAFQASVDWISAHITGAHLNHIELNPLPGFLAALHTPETEVVKKQYLKTKKTMIETYQGKDFLETTLRQLTEAKIPSHFEDVR